MATLDQILAEHVPPVTPEATEDERLFQLLILSPTTYAQAVAEGIITAEHAALIDQALALHAES